MSARGMLATVVLRRAFAGIATFVITLVLTMPLLVIADVFGSIAAGAVIVVAITSVTTIIAALRGNKLGDALYDLRVVPDLALAELRPARLAVLIRSSDIVAV